MFDNNLLIFCERNEKYKQKFSSSGEFDKLEPDRILEILCEFLMQPKCTKDVAECFPELLPALISMTILENDIPLYPLSERNNIHRLNCVILGMLVNLNQDLLVFVLRYFDVNPAPYKSLDAYSCFNPPPKKRNKKRLLYTISEISDYDIVIACHNILQSAINHFRRKWDWFKLYKYLMNPDDRVKWIALKCIAILWNMSEARRLHLAQKFIPNFEKFLTDYENKSTNTHIACADFKSMKDTVKNTLSVVSVGDILLPTFSKNQKTYDLVPVTSTRKNLQNLAIAVGSRKCICLQGPVGCGKTALVEYLARVTGHDMSNFVKVQLGDQTDSKMLLGMYRCTDVPGEFVWQPGVLTQAVVAGKWLLLEDIDSAALDVASVLSNLIETGTLCVPGYRETIYTNSGFQLFVTQQLMMSATGIQRHVTGSSSLLQKHWLCLNVEPLSKNELVTIVQTLFPPLSTIATRIVDVFLLFSVGDHDESSANDATLSLKIGRQTSTRDLIKWCSRAIVNFDVSSPDSALKIYQDALDIFCWSVPNQVQRLNLAIAVAEKLGIVKTKAEYFCDLHKPSISLLPEFLISGRAKLTRKKAPYVTFERDNTRFYFTRPSACLLERIASCVMQKEPVLLVGETGTGKTSSLQYLAKSTGHKLTIINMNQQSESADLLGGYKPVDLKFLIRPIREEFESMFRTFFVVESRNELVLKHIGVFYQEQKWKSLIEVMRHITLCAVKKLRDKCKKYFEHVHAAFQKDVPKYFEQDKIIRKRYINDNEAQAKIDKLRKWERMQEKLDKLKAQVKSALAFSFIEGSLIKALRNGYWVLLDEINLANAETLQCLSGLLEGSSESLPLLERGDKEPVKRHPDFTIFACMNPATDVGKKDLPVGLRNRFTEFYIDELTQKPDLRLLVSSYLERQNLSLDIHEAIVNFYLNVRELAISTLFDGTAHKPHYSLRTLCRALHISASNPCGNSLRSLYEAFSLSFLTQLDYNSYPIVQNMIVKAILNNKNVKAILNTPISMPRCPGEEYIKVEGYWVPQGHLTPQTPSNYILTDSVRRNLKDLVRVVSIGKIPVLLQGDTSVGKTSLITYLAKITGHVCVRINNHEHTDLQEYIGSYIADETGKLVFKEGILVDAMRKGHWIILDELNLAPSDVLEALNRVLDDNRELFIPETHQVVRAHRYFMLFATQNPPGLYGGRKILSRAFRNRFVELHFDEIPPNELQIILGKRCSMPESYCKEIINVMTDLQIRRKSTAAFAGKKGFVTLRDLFRWGERYRLADDVGKLYDWRQHLADEGYLVLAAKVRKAEEANQIRQVIKKHLKKDVDPESLFTLNDKTSPVTRHILEKIVNNSVPGFSHIVWTYHMRRMAVLVKKSCQFKEPILLVGETGGGKTTICQLIAAINGQTMHSVNSHMHTESSDFLGNLRPVREHVDDDQRLFEWVDGPLINAMRNGDLFLADEISLADDSVLERLNSLLEPERSLLLTEKGIDSSHDDENTVIVADEKFVFVGTMNPGGDYGKKELSPALRNRFTEIWCEGCTTRNDLHDIIVHNLRMDSQTTKEAIATAILRFTEWLHTTEVGKKLVVTIRDMLTWVDFINRCTCNAVLSKLTIAEVYYHGACLTYIDSLGSGSTSSENINKLKNFAEAAIRFIKSVIEDTIKTDLNMETSVVKEKVEDTLNVFGVPPFYIEKGPLVSCEDCKFTFTTPTTKLNTLKLLRALQLNKPILLEGSPGVGKTSLVSAVAKASGHTLLRINLSDQTDISDLFGADLPVESGKGGEFAWRDGPFLRALRAGHWILLDELNLASQSVLEGLNACFDHRGEIYIPELAKTFLVKPGTRLFGCQNPLRQGGARRGLPKSFLNRFTQISVDALMEDDLKFILNLQFPQLSAALIKNMVQFNNKLASEAGFVWGHAGSPWEMNLRDITRWCEMTIQAASNKFCSNKQYFNPGDTVELIYVNRMRTNEDRQKIYQIYEEMFSPEKYPLPPNQLPMHITADKLFIGDVTLDRKNRNTYEDCNLLVLRDQKTALKSLMQCVKMNWMSILVGGPGCGKSNVVRLLATLTGQKLKSIAMNSAIDTTEILGGFEQTDYNRHLEQLFERTATLLIDSLQMKITVEKLDQVAKLHEHLERVRHLFDENVAGRTMAAETKLFLHKIEEMSKLVSTMKLWIPCHESELQDIESGLRNLSSFVEKDDCLNAGGKFEWVDSVLVKCLQDGTWLLIDQVNLCSPAVLDRLNGLLEPNGVLSIGERGVDREGNIVTIKPHENFRLFLTMDPRYGDISRAMRNRGVEIYMLGPKENVDYDAIDLKSLLFNAGIARSAYRDALLEVHSMMSEEIVAADRLSTVDLLHAAFLVKRRLLRGFSAEQAIGNACIDVYVKARSTRDPRFKEQLISLIDEIVKRHVTHDEEISVIDLDAATWNVKNLQDNSKLTIIRQQGLLLSAAVKMHELCLKSNSNDIENTVTTKLLNDFCGFKEDDEFVLDTDVADVLPYFLLHFYEQSSLDDAPLRGAWLSKMLQKNAIFNEFEKHSSLMMKLIALFRFRSANVEGSLPWDLQQLVGSAIYDENETAYSDANKLSLLLYTYSMIFEKNRALTKASEILENENLISVRKYCSTVDEGTLSWKLGDKPLLRKFTQLLKYVNSSVETTLRDDSVSVNVEEYVELRKELKWLARFEKLGEMTLVNKSKKSEGVFTNLEQISSLLLVHYKWLLKFLRKLFIKKRSSSEIELLSELVSNLNNQLITIYDPVKKIAKRIKKHLTLPLPHSTELCMQVYSGLRKITKDFSVRDEGVSVLKRELKLISVQLKDASAMRYQTISLWSDVYSGKTIDETTLQTIREVERFCDDSHIRLRVPAEIESVLSRVRSLPAKEMTQLNARIQLWPIYEYVFLSLAGVFQGEICRAGTTSAVTAAGCLARFADVPGIPSDLMGLLSAMTRVEVGRRQKVLMLPELFHRLAQFVQQSHAVKDTSCLLQWSGVTEESVTSYVQPKMECYFGGPILLNIILQLMLRKTNREKEKDALSTIALGTYAAQMDQLQLLSEILWRNSVSLTSKQYDLASSDVATLKFYLHLYLSAIDRMNAEHDVRNLITIAVQRQGSNATMIEQKLQLDYFQPVKELREACEEISTIDEEKVSEEERILRRGKAWMSLGYIQLSLFGNLDLIDPVHKVELKLKYLEEDIADYRKTIYVATLQSRILETSADDRHIHPRIAAMKIYERRLLKSRSDLSCLKAIRPPLVDFVSLSRDSTNFRNNVGSYEVMKKQMNSLCAIAHEILSQGCTTDVQTAETNLQEAEIWSLSIQRFAEQIETKYLSGFPDVVLPLLAALAQLNHGVRILINEIRRLMSLRKSRVADLDSLIYNLIRFPTIGRQQEDLLSLSGLCVSENTRSLISKSFSQTDAFVRMQEQFRIFKSGLHELHNHVILNKNLTKSLWRNVNELLQQMVLIWKQQQQEEEKRAAERDSLYKNKTESHSDTLTEEEELALEVRKLFPTHREKDFHDLEDSSKASLGRKNTASPESCEANVSFSGLITKDDIREIQQIHSNIVTSFIASRWICNGPASTILTNYVGPLIQRYNTVHAMLDDVLPSLSGKVAIKLYNSLSLLVALGLETNRETSAGRVTWENSGGRARAYNFYKDCDVEAVKQCLPLCESILNRTDQLLEEWPDHPTLRSIRCIIDRLHTFPIASPVSRFLTGLELLHVKMHEWEQNAHRGVSMMDHISALTQQIISWRKLELSSWKGCLDATYEELRSDTSKWWFFLYALVESYITRSVKDDAERASDELVTRQKLIESLERFMNESSLVEFESRLNLLLTFHCHVYYFEDSDDRNELSAVLWNMYNYYKQFVDDVNARIAALKAPIEKKLRDFVKIARWNDFNYWAVKETVVKTHRSLHKFVKEFQGVLKQNVSSCLTVKSGSYSAEISKGDQNHLKYAISPEDFTVTKLSQSTDVKVLFTSGLIVKAETLLTKAKHLCKEIVLMSSYPYIRSKLEIFVEDFLEQSAHLRNMEVDRSLPKGKQKSQAKSILQQKKMTLANYFKTLTRMGVSYRTGVLTLRNSADKVIDFTVSPLDLSAIDRYFEPKRIDQHVLLQWQGCEKYYYKSLIRLNALNAMLNANRTDLGLQNIERCRGYSAHMMLLAHRQKTTIVQSFDRFSSLRVLISNLSETREQDLSVLKQRDGRECAESLKTLLITLETGFEQLLLFLQCCPAESSTEPNRAVLTLSANALPIIAASRNDEVWRNANALLKDSLDRVQVVAKRFHASFVPFEVLSADRSEHSVRASFLSSKHFELLAECCATIEVLRGRSKELGQLFENADVAHPICEHVVFLDAKMECFLRNYEKLRKPAEIEIEEQLKENDDDIKQYELALEQLISMILLVIQKKYKHHINLNDDSNEQLNNNENDNDNEEEEIEENQMSERLVEFLEKDITELKLSKISESFSTLLLSLNQFDLQSANYCIRLLLKCLPLLEQYILLAQFYLNEQVASFRITCKMLYLQLNVFLDLAANGFCVPKDLDLEEGETDESGEKTEKGGMGLADGEGTKDVSDRIESEDQLEEAKPAGQEQEKQDDKTCKEEEKGIDMSEDFDSKLQDMEKGDEDEEQSDNDEENDLDKEMGETGEGAEQLDKEIWGDDKEEPEEDDQQPENDEDEKEGTGEQIGEKEMGAKNDEGRKKQHDDNDTDREESQEEDGKEINELNEPEVDEDQINPYHGKFQPPPEPEPLELPEDINLDDKEGKEDNGGEEENPFDIDEMKDLHPPPEKHDTEVEREPDENKENDGEDSSENGDENIDTDGQKTQEEPEGDKEKEEKSGESAEAENKDEELNQDDEEKLQEKAAPSANDASKQMDAAQQVEETAEGSRDTVAQQPDAKNQQEASAENAQEDSSDKGSGQSQSMQQESGHCGSSKQETMSAPQRNAMSKPNEKRKNPGESSEDRSLLERFEPSLKKLKTIYTQDEVSKDEKEDDSGNANGNEAEMAQHIKDSERFDDYTLDAATEDQVKQQASNTEKEEENQKEKNDDTMDVEMHEDERNDKMDDKIIEQKPEKISEAVDNKRKKDSDGKRNNAEDSQMETVELEGETVKTMHVQRGNESTFHTMDRNLEENDPDSNCVEKNRFEVERMLQEWTQMPSTEEAAAAWNCLCSVTDAAARDLSEKLRLILEPTQASRLKGDYKTGKRINMRKIIPYIASQFRKDKIWLRRTKPSKRDYQIVLALDDSLSMADTQSAELTFESLSLISKAMTYLEVGQFSVVNFGEDVKMLHPFGEAFTEQTGSRLIQEMRFNQRKTRVDQLVNFTVDMFESQHTTSDNAKLLVVLSDGRNIFAEGTTKVIRAVRRARLVDIFLVFVIMDNPKSQYSILDVRTPVFDEKGKFLELRSYMDSFPFPFYIILRDINTLPGVLSDALRQWFEVVGKIDT